MFGFGYSDINKNLYNHDMNKYDRFVSKELKRKADNDKFNFISLPNQIPYRDYFIIVQKAKTIIIWKCFLQIMKQ